MLRIEPGLFAAAQAGDRAALERLLAQLRPDIQRYARFQCYASSSVEDVVQEALTAAVSSDHVIAIPALIAALIAFRGCPMCWTLGLIERWTHHD